MSYGPPNLDYERLPVCSDFGPMIHAPLPGQMLSRNKLAPNQIIGSPTKLQRGTANEDSWPQCHLMKCAQSAYRKMTEHLSSREPEAAGVLLGPSGEPNLVTHFVPDEHGESTPVSFRLDITRLNRRLKIAKAAELSCHGIVHSHPRNITQPSGGDLAYLQQLFALPKNDATQPFFVPIFCGQTLHPYVYLDGTIHPALLLLV